MSKEVKIEVRTTQELKTALAELATTEGFDTYSAWQTHEWKKRIARAKAKSK